VNEKKETITEAEIFEPEQTQAVFGAETIDELTGGKGDEDDG